MLSPVPWPHLKAGALPVLCIVPIVGRCFSVLDAWVDAHEKYIALASTAATSAAAYYAAKAAHYSRRSVETQLQPVMGVSGIAAPAFNTPPGYAVFIKFANHGKGAANVSVVESDRRDIKANVGTPLVVGPDRETQVKLWLPTTNEEHVRLSLCYWDIIGNHYATEVCIYVKWHEFNPTYRLDSERVVSLGRRKVPKKVLQWPRPSLFHRKWWEETPDC